MTIVGNNLKFLFSIPWMPDILRSILSTDSIKRLLLHLTCLKHFTSGTKDISKKHKTMSQIDFGSEMRLKRIIERRQR